MGTTRIHEDGAAGQLELVQSRIVTDDVAGLATFYSVLVGTDVVVNDFYVEVPTAAQRVGLARRRYSELDGACGPPSSVPIGAVILDFAARQLDDEFARLDALGVEWLMGPTLQPWGRRSMMLRDPEGHLINVFEKKEDES